MGTYIKTNIYVIKPSKKFFLEKLTFVKKFVEISRTFSMFKYCFIYFFRL